LGIGQRFRQRDLQVLSLLGCGQRLLSAQQRLASKQGTNAGTSLNGINSVSLPDGSGNCFFQLRIP
jgi:hypothetical protein